MTQRKMYSRTARLAIAGVLAGSMTLLAACGGSSGSSTTAAASAAATPATSSSGLDLGSPGGGGTNSSAAVAHAKSVDVCGLFTQDDAVAVAHERGLGGDSATTATFTLTTEDVPSTGDINPAHGCLFHFNESLHGEAPSTTVTIQMLVSAATNFSLYSVQASKVPGLGDEAYDNGSSTYVRVGDIQLTTGENSAGDEFANAMYKRMVPRIH